MITKFIFLLKTNLFLHLYLASTLEKLMNGLKWLISFKQSKTRCMTISNKIKKSFHSSLIFDDVHLKELESHKHIGVIFNCNLSWNIHSDKTKFHQKIGEMGKVKFILDRNCLRKI